MLCWTACSSIALGCADDACVAKRDIWIETGSSLTSLFLIRSREFSKARREFSMTRPADTSLVLSGMRLVGSYVRLGSMAASVSQ